MVLAEESRDEVGSGLLRLRACEEEVLKRVGVDVVVVAQGEALVGGTVLQGRKHHYALVDAQRIVKTEGKGLVRTYAFADL